MMFAISDAGQQSPIEIRETIPISLKLEEGLKCIFRIKQPVQKVDAGNEARIVARDFRSLCMSLRVTFLTARRDNICSVTC